MAKRKTKKRAPKYPPNSGYAYFGAMGEATDEPLSLEEQWRQQQQGFDSPWSQRAFSNLAPVDFGEMAFNIGKGVKSDVQDIKQDIGNRKAAKNTPGYTFKTSRITGESFNLDDTSGGGDRGMGINPSRKGDWKSNAISNQPTPQLTNPLEEEPEEERGMPAGVSAGLGALRGVGQAAHNIFSGAIAALPGLIPDSQKYKRPAPNMAYNANPYGTGSSALYNYGGYMPYPQANQGMAMPISNGQLQVEGGQYSFLSPETINLGGDPHSSGGTKVSYGGNMVEAEAGEPMSIGQDGQAVVWGNMYVPGTNTKFKGAAKKIAKEEKKNTQMLGKATKLLQGSNPLNPNEALSFNTGKALNDASVQNQKKISAYKDSLATLQQAMLDYSEQTGIKPDKLGKSMKKGGSIPMPKYKKGGCMECGGSFQDGGGIKKPVSYNPNFPYPTYQGFGIYEPGEITREDSASYDIDYGQALHNDPFANRMLERYNTYGIPTQGARGQNFSKDQYFKDIRQRNAYEQGVRDRVLKPSSQDVLINQVLQGNYMKESGGFVPIAGKEYGIASYPMFPPEDNSEMPLALYGWSDMGEDMNLAYTQENTLQEGQLARFGARVPKAKKRYQGGGEVGDTSQFPNLLPGVTLHETRNPEVRTLFNEFALDPNFPPRDNLLYNTLVEQWANTGKPNIKRTSVKDSPLHRSDGSVRPYYNFITENMILPKSEEIEGYASKNHRDRLLYDYMSELSHSKQDNDENIFQSIKRNLNDLWIAPAFNQEDYDALQYTTPGASEYQAHTVIQPQLERDLYTGTGRSFDSTKPYEALLYNNALEETEKAWKRHREMGNWNSHKKIVRKKKYGGQIGNVGDEIELSPEQLAYYRSLGYEFE